MLEAFTLVSPHMHCTIIASERSELADLVVSRARFYVYSAGHEDDRTFIFLLMKHSPAT